MFATPAFAQTAGAAAPGGDIMSMLQTLGLPIILFVLFYVMILRPQQKRQRAHQAMVAAVKRGETVVLNSGFVGKVSKVEDTEVQVEIASGVNVTVLKSAIAEVRTRATPAANDSK